MNAPKARPSGTRGWKRQWESRIQQSHKMADFSGFQDGRLRRRQAEMRCRSCGSVLPIGNVRRQGRSCDNSQLASSGSDKMVILWDVSTAKMLRRFRGHVGRVNCIRFNEESTVIASGSIDNTVRLWDCRAKKYDPIQILDEAKDGIFSVKLSDHEILTGSVDGRVRRYDLRVGELLVDYIGSPVTCVCFTKDGQCVLSSALDSTLRLLDKDTGELLGEYTGHKSSEFKTDCCLTNSDAHVVSGSEDGTIYFWDLVDGKVVHKLSKAGKGVVHSLSYHPSLPCMLSAAENTVKVWREEDYQEE